jgi:hypothetical protein
MQDKIFATENAVILLDGATDPDASEKDGGWIADEIGQHVTRSLTDNPSLDLIHAVAAAIRDTTERHHLVAERSPSTTVTVARWSDTVIDVLVLGDSPAIVGYRNGKVDAVQDLRLAELPGRERFGPPPTEASAAIDRTRQLIKYERSMRNRADGYWIAATDPRAAHHAITRTIPRRDCAALLLMTDGVADGINRYGEPRSWSEALRVAATDVTKLVMLVHAIEETDIDRSRWPRSKVHDDKAAALIDFG